MSPLDTFSILAEMQEPKIKTHSRSSIS